MTDDSSSAGDPRRSLELLWGLAPPRRRGPRPRLTLEDIATAAIELADAEGLAALSMRRVADRLSVATMSLYTYVPSKAELIDVMLDRVYGETSKIYAVGAAWRARLEQVARDNWELYHRHPWMLQVVSHRPVLGPNLIAKYDFELRAIEGQGLSDLEMDHVVSLIANYVHGAVRSAVEASQAESRTGLTDAQWWEISGPLLEKVFDPAKFPTAARVGKAAGEAYDAVGDPERAFSFGLDRVLDGVEALITRRRA